MLLAIGGGSNKTKAVTIYVLEEYFLPCIDVHKRVMKYLQMPEGIYSFGDLENPTWSYPVIILVKERE